MEDVIKSQREDIEKSTKLLEAVIDGIENFQKSMPHEFWQLITEKFNGPELFQDLNVAKVEVLRLQRAAKGEIN